MQLSAIILFIIDNVNGKWWVRYLLMRVLDRVNSRIFCCHIFSFSL